MLTDPLSEAREALRTVYMLGVSPERLLRIEHLVARLDALPAPERHDWDRTYPDRSEHGWFYPDAPVVDVAALRQQPSVAREPKLTHGRHCPCSACSSENWTNPRLAHCGMHGPGCPNVYAPVARENGGKT